MAEYYNNNSFTIGTLLFTCVYFTIVLYSIICMVWKIRIKEFVIFPSFNAAVYSKTINGVKFILGWFPASGAITPYGHTHNKEQELTYSPQDLGHVFFNKPRYVKALFRLAPVITFLLVSCIAVYILNPSSPFTEVKQIILYMAAAVKAMFADESARDAFILRTYEFITGKNIVVFSFAVLTIVITLQQILFLFYSGGEEKSMLYSIIALIVFLPVLWFLLWKTPKFIFSFFTLTQSISYVVSFISGFILTGLLLFFLTLVVVKGVSKN